jgi:outer membrane protein assembly factor BamB
MTTSTGPFGWLLLWACATALLSSDGVGARHVPQWSGFRGTNATGIADRDTPPITFGPAEKLLWKRAIPPGHSSPVVWDDRIFLTAADGWSLHVMALRRRDGAMLWTRSIAAEHSQALHTSASPAAPTPVTDGRRVVAYFPSFGLIAFDREGVELWRHPLPLMPIQFGTGSSPILVAGTVVLQRDGASADAELLALDAASGQVRWRTPRSLMGESWSTPVVWRHGDVEEIVTLGASKVVGYGLDGTERWSVGGLPGQSIALAVPGDDVLYASAFYATGTPESPWQVPSWTELSERYDGDRDGVVRIVDVPADVQIPLRPEVSSRTDGSSLALRRVLQIVDKDKDAATTQAEYDGSIASLRSRTNTVMAIRPGGRGDSTVTHVAWKDSRGVPEIPSPLFYRDRLYLVRDGGLLTSYAPDGTPHLDRRRLGVLGQYVASPVAADGRLYVASQSGTVVVVRAGDTLDVLARNDLGEPIVATPAIAADTLFVRSAGHLWAFGEAAPEPSPGISQRQQR